MRSADQLDGAVGEDLVHIHVDRCARATLKGIGEKLVRELALGHLPGRLDYALAYPFIKEARPYVRQGACLFHFAERPNQFLRCPEPRHGKILPCPDRMDAVVRILGYLDRAEKVMFCSVVHPAFALRTFGPPPLSLP